MLQLLRAHGPSRTFWAFRPTVIRWLRNMWRNHPNLIFLAKIILVAIFLHWGRDYVPNRKPAPRKIVVKDEPKYDSWLSCPVPENEPQEDRLLSIFFLDMVKDKLDVTDREACSIASAAQHHPGKDVILYHLSPNMTNNGSNLNVLRMMPNVHLKQLNLADLFSCTPLADWYSDGMNRVNRHTDYAVKAATRYAILHRYGGIYLATDVIVLRPMTKLKNCMGCEYLDTLIGSSVMIFDSFHPFIYRCMENVADNNTGVDYLGKPISTSNFGNPHCRLDKDGEKLCKNVTLLRSDAFYPLQELDWIRQFLPITWSGLDISGSYSVCLYSRRTSKKMAVPGNNSLIEMLAHENCPHIYKRMLSKNEI